MTTANESRGSDDPRDLGRFVQAQKDGYTQALKEIRSGRKRTHWMWYVFPQIDGLAFSSTAKHYSIKSALEAQAYLDHPILGPRLRECTEAVIRVEGRSVLEIFGSPDDLKLKSCATLFASLLPPDSVFDRLLEKYYRARDEKNIAVAEEPTLNGSCFLTPPLTSTRRALVLSDQALTDKKTGQC
jgi:uncharacterized protein (DUF1810 family)